MAADEPPSPQTNALFAINASLAAVLALGFLKDFFGLAT
jgi:hypothetical protein